MSLFIKIFTFIALIFSLLGCDFATDTSLSKKADEFELGNKHGKALEYYDKLIKLNGKNQASVKYAKLAAGIAYIKTKEYERAIKYYRFIIINSENPSERLEAQKTITDIYFTHIPSPDNQEAITEISKLLTLGLEPEERVRYHTHLAKAYFRANNFYQAQVEIDQILKEVKDKEKRYELKKLKADIYLASKNQAEAINIYNDLLKEFPDKSKHDEIGLNLAVCYEDQDKYDKAIEVLTSLKKNTDKTEYLDLRIKRLKERLSLQPGAQGLRK